MLSKLKLHRFSNGFIKYSYNTLWLVLERVLRIIVGIFIGIWIARYLGPEQFGLLSYAQSFVGLFGVIATFGLDSIVIRNLVLDESKRDVLLGTSFLLKFIGAFVVLLILLFAINFTSNDTYTNTLIFIIASGIIFQSFNVIDFYFQSQVLSHYVVYINIIGLFLSSIVKIVLLSNEASLLSFAYVMVFDNFILASGFIYFYFKNNLSLLKWKFNKTIALNLLKDSWTLMLSGMVILIYMRIDQVMIQQMIGNDAVGQYSAAIRLAEAWYFIPGIVAASLFPAVINAKKVSETLYYSRIYKLYKLLLFIALIIAVLTTLYSDWIINLLYGEQYSQSAYVLVIYIWVGVFTPLGIVSSNWLVVENLQKYSFYRALIGAVVNVILNVILIPKYSMCGAAYATLISQILATYVFDIFTKNTRKMFFMKTRALLFYKHDNYINK